jgi:hypothetical protein
MDVIYFILNIHEMISHECSSIKYKYYLLNYFVKFTLHTSQFHFAKWWSKLLFLQNPLFLVVKSTLPNHRVNSAWLSSPCCQVSIPKLPIPHHQINIAKLSSLNSLCELPEMSFELPISLKKIGLSNAIIFSGLLKLLPKKIKPPWSPPPPQDFSLPFFFLLTW